KNKIKDFFTLDEEYEYVEEEEAELVPQYQNKQNVINLTKMQNPTSKVVLCEPKTYNEAQEIADNIVNRRAVVINLQRIAHEQAMRVVDFLRAPVYALNGDIQKLGSETCPCTPDIVDISATISGSPHDEDEFEKVW